MAETKIIINALKKILTELGNLDEGMKIVIDAIKTILTDLGKLDDEQLAQIVEGTLRFTCESTKRSNKSTSSQSVFDATAFEEYKQKISMFSSRADAAQYLKTLNLKVAELKEFAKYLNLTGLPGKKDDLLNFIVNNTIGFRIDAEGVART
jgi:hypothetical protein